MLAVVTFPRGRITTLAGEATLSRGLSHHRITPVARLGRALVAEHQAESSFRVQQLLMQLRVATRPPTTTGTPSPWGSRPTGDPAFSDRQTSERDVGAPFAPLSDLAGRRSPAGRLPAEGLNPPYAGNPAMDVVVGKSSVLPLRAGVQAV